MYRHTQLWTFLILQVVSVIIFILAPRFVDVLLPDTPTELATDSSAPIGSSNYDPNGVDFSPANYVEPLKTVVKVVTGVMVTIGTLGILLTAIRIVFSNLTDGGPSSRTSYSRTSTSRRQRETPQPTVADALEGLLASENSPSTSNDDLNVPSSNPEEEQRTFQSQLVKEDTSNNAAARVIRENTTIQNDDDSADNSGELKRVIRG